MELISDITKTAVILPKEKSNTMTLNDIFVNTDQSITQSLSG